MLRAACYVLLVSGACAAPRTTARVALDPGMTIRVLVENRIVNVPREHYVRTVILSEFAPGGTDAAVAERMLEVDAIVSRTYALTPRHLAEGYDMCSTTHCQLYDPVRVAKSRWIGAADEAVQRTTGVTVWFGDRRAEVVYHADCGGRTSAAEDVWAGKPVSYLMSVADAEVGSVHTRWQFAPEHAALRAALNIDERTRVGDILNRIDIVRRDRGGRAQLIALDGQRSPVVRGEELRTVLTRAFGPRALRSTNFEVVRNDRGFEFTGRGFGHGVGLCQVGAHARIAAGATPAEVVSHYFPGTSIH